MGRGVFGEGRWGGGSLRREGGAGGGRLYRRMGGRRGRSDWLID